MQKLFLADISTATHLDIRNKLENNDYIYVTGGNTFFLLQEMNKSGAGDLVKAQINAGKLFIGESQWKITASAARHLLHRF